MHELSSSVIFSYYSSSCYMYIVDPVDGGGRELKMMFSKFHIQFMSLADFLSNTEPKNVHENDCVYSYT